MILGLVILLFLYYFILLYCYITYKNNGKDDAITNVVDVAKSQVGIWLCPLAGVDFSRNRREEIAENPPNLNPNGLIRPGAGSMHQGYRL